MKKLLPETKHYAVNSVFKALEKIHPQLFQNIGIGFLLLVGGKYGGFIDISWTALFIIFSTVMLTDFLLSKYIKKKTIIPLSAINSGIGIAFFIRTKLLPVYALAGFIAILTKYLVNIKGKHFLNPSYTAVFLCLLFFPEKVYTDPLQWRINYEHILPFQNYLDLSLLHPALNGANLPVLALILIVGTVVMLRVGLFDIVLTYFLAFFASLYFFTSFSVEDLVILYLSGSFFIIAFFGLTDPAILPKKRIYRILYACQVAFLFFIFRLFINENYAFFVGYFLVNILEIFFWSIEGKKIKFKNKIIDARIFWQSLTTLIFLFLMINTSVNHQIKYNNVKPEILTNRCTKIICNTEETLNNLELLKPYFLNK